MGIERRSWGAYAGLAAWFALFLLYSISFNSYDVVREEHSVLGDADASNYIYLFENFQLSRVYGDPYTHTSEGRSIGDNAQKHKVHHILYVVVAAGIHAVLDAVYGWLGLSWLRAVYSVNAVVVCVNLGLIYFLLPHFNPRHNPRFPFVVFYAFALSTWVFGSIPDSWPFTGTLILLFLLAFYKTSPHYLVLAALIGLFMLGNLILAFLLVFVLIKLLRQHADWVAVIARSLAAALVTLATWLSLLSGISLFDPHFRPDHYFKLTFWYKEFVSLDLTFLSPYVWKSVLSNLFITSIVSNQPDPFVPQEAMLVTIRTSFLGLVAAGAYVALLCLLGIATVRELRPVVASRGARYVLVEERGVHLLVCCALMVWITIFLYYASGFIYSTTIVGLIAMILCRFLDLSKPLHKALLYGALAVLIANNTAQVLRFREALAAMA